MFDTLSLSERPSVAPHYLRLALNLSANPRGFHTEALDCIRILAQNFTSVAELRHELTQKHRITTEKNQSRKRPEMTLWSKDLFKSLQGSDGSSDDGAGQSLPDHSVDDEKAGFSARARLDRQILTGVFERCTEIAGRVQLPSVSEIYRIVARKENEHPKKKAGAADGEHSSGFRTVSEQLMTWIGLEVKAAAACAKEVGRVLSLSDGQPLHRKNRRQL